MRKFAVTGIGHAVMDIQASVQDIALIALGYPKGQRHLLTLDQLMALENTIFSPIPNESGFLRESRGGSIANSLGVMAGVINFLPRSSANTSRLMAAAKGG